MEVVMILLFILFSIIVGFGVVSLLITYLFSEPIFIWCRKRWLRVLKESFSESAMSNYLYERLAKDQMKSLFSEVEFHLIQVLLSFGVIVYALEDYYNNHINPHFNWGLLSLSIPIIILTLIFWTLHKKNKLFIVEEPGESQATVTFTGFIYIFILGIIGSFVIFLTPESRNWFLPLIVAGVCIGVEIFLTFGRIGIIQLNKRIPLRAHEEQTDRLIQDLFLHCPDFTRRWLLINMEHQDPKVATFAQKWVTKYL